MKVSLIFGFFVFNLYAAVQEVRGDRKGCPCQLWKGLREARRHR